MQKYLPYCVLLGCRNIFYHIVFWEDEEISSTILCSGMMKKYEQIFNSLPLNLIYISNLFPVVGYICRYLGTVLYRNFISLTVLHYKQYSFPMYSSCSTLSIVTFSSSGMGGGGFGGIEPKPNGFLQSGIYKEA